jgi:hypothetical protein
MTTLDASDIQAAYDAASRNNVEPSSLSSTPRWTGEAWNTDSCGGERRPVDTVPKRPV